MMGWVFSFITGCETPTDREARVDAAARDLAKAQIELSEAISKDSATMRAAFRELLKTKAEPND